MIPPPAFEQRLRGLKAELFVRWEHWEYVDEEGRPAFLPFEGGWAPVAGAEIPDGRWVIYDVDRWGEPYFVMDVCHSDGSYHPLDERVIRALARRHDVWDELDQEAEMAAEAKRKATRAGDGPAEELADDALAQLWREEKGTHAHALGAPGAPAAPRTGFTYIDKRRFAHHLEA